MLIGNTSVLCLISCCFKHCYWFPLRTETPSSSVKYSRKIHSELLPGNLTTHRKIVHLKISSECTYIQSSNFFSKHLGADVRLWLLMWMFVDVPARHYLSAHLCNDKCVRTQANARFTCMCILVYGYGYGYGYGYAYMYTHISYAYVY